MSSRLRAPRRPVRVSLPASRRQRLMRAAVEVLEARQLLSHTLTISTGPTSNVLAAGGSFTATGDNANLNISDLQNAVNAGDVSISTGADGTQAGQIFWLGGADLTYAGPTTHTLTIDTGGDPLGGFHLFSNIQTTAPLNLNVSTAGVVDLGATVGDGGAAVSITANSFDFSNSAAQLNVGSGSVLIQPSSAGRAIDIGQGNTGGDLDIRNADLNGIVAAALQIGSTAAGPVTVTAAVQQPGDSNVTVISANQILVPTGDGWTTTHGSLTLLANQQAARTGGTFNGIYLNGGQLATSDGAIVLQGTSGSGGGSGILLDSSASIQSVSGTISLQGTGVASGTDLGNGALIKSTNGGTVTVAGAAATQDAPGVLFDHGSTLSAGTANVVLTGDTIELGDFHSITSSAIGGGNGVRFQPLTPSRNIVLDSFTDVPGALTLTVHDLSAIVLGAQAPGAPFFSGLTVGRDDGTGAVTVAQNFNLSVPLRINTPGAGSAGINITTTLSSSSSPLGGAGLTLNSGGTLTTSPSGLISAPSLLLIGQTGIGSLAAPLSVKTSALGALNTTGGIYITNTNAGALRIGGVGGGGVSSATSGDIQIINPATLTLDVSGENVVGHGNILLQANGATADVNVGRGTSVAAPNGAVTLQAGRDVVVGTNSSATINNQAGGNSSVVLTAARDVIVNNLGVVNAFGTGTITATAGRNVQILHTQAASGARVWSQSGAIQLTAGPGGNFTLDGDASQGTLRSNLVGGGADITITADTVNLTTRDNIQAGTGAVTVQPVTTGQKIDLGSTTDAAANTLELSNAELADVQSASVLRIGRSSGDGLTVTDAITPAHVTTLTLINGGAMSEAAGGSLTVSNLAIKSGGQDLLTNVNAVSTLAANSAGGIRFNNGATPLAIGVVDGVTGVSTTNSAAEIDADALDVQQAINAGTGNVILAPSTASVGVSVGAEIAGSLSVTDAELANVTAGLLQLGNSAAGDLFVNATVTAHPGFSALSLQSGGRVVEFAPITVASLSSVSVNNASLNQPNQVGTYAGQSTGAGQTITLQDAQDLTIGAVGAITGITTNGANVNLNVTGNLTIDADISTASGAISLSPIGGDVTQAAGSTVTGRSITQTGGKTLSTYSGTLHSIGGVGVNLNATSLAVPGHIIVDTGPATFAVTSSATPSTISGIISGAGGAVVNGAGIVIFSGANTYTGTTTVNQGNLVVNGSIASTNQFNILGGTGAGSRAATLSGSGTVASQLNVGNVSTVTGSITFQNSVTVNGGTFSGTETILGSTSVLAGTLSPRGTPIGTMNAAGVAFSPGTNFSVNLTNTGNDLLNGSGDFNLGGANLRPTINFVPGIATTFTVMQTTGNITGQFAQGNAVTLGARRYLIAYNPHSVVLELSADLGVVVSAPATVTAGGNVDYTITVTNNSPTDAQNLVITDTLPASESFVSTPNTSSLQSSSNNQIVFASPALASGASQVYVITAHVSSSVAAGSTVTDSATVSNDIPDANPANNTGTASSTVSTSADLFVSPTAPANGVEDSPVTYTITVHNSGPSDAQNVVVNTPIPAGVAFVSASQISGPAMTFTPPVVAGGNFTVSMASLGLGLSATFTLAVNPLEEGQLTLTPTVSSATSDPNSANNSASATVNVVDARIMVTRLFSQPFPAEGQSFAADLASIVDSNPLGTAADFSATIAWGDGSVSPAVLGRSSGTAIIVSAMHTYSEEGVYNVSVTVNDVGGSSGSANLQLNVVDAPLTAQAATINAVKNQSFTGKVASFTDASATPDVFDYIAAINWGDGVVSNGLVQANNSGGFDVIGTHTYTQTGTLPVAVSIHDVAAGAVAHSTANITASANAQAVPLIGHLVATNGAAVEGKIATRQVATFVSSDLTASDFTATVDWGDGSTSAAKLQLTNGTYHVAATHAFANYGAYQGKVTIFAGGLPVGAASFKSAVADAPLTAAGARNISAKVNHSLSGVLGAFTDANVHNTDAAQYTASINWGDGKTSAGSITFNKSAGKWQISGAHTFANKGIFKVKINVKDAGGAATQVIALITVS